MKKVLILGAAGMAGHMLGQYLRNSKNFDLLKTVRNNASANLDEVELELSDHAGLQNIIGAFRPNVVINCAGLLIHSSNNNPAEAIHINSYLPHYLVQLSERFDFKLIHISTDCVFEGTRGKYSEHDIPDATSIYGRSKALGEILDHPKHLTIRTSIIGPELKTNGTGLMHWLFNQNGNINGYTQAIWSGVTTLELAKFIVHVIQYDQNNQCVSGLYHLTNNTNISKFDLLNLIREVFNLSHITILADKQYTSDKSIVQLQPANMEFEVPSYHQMITEIKQYTHLNSQLYKHYPIF